jgi:hypothetical protein
MTIVSGVTDGSPVTAGVVARPAAVGPGDSVTALEAPRDRVGPAIGPGGRARARAGTTAVPMAMGQGAEAVMTDAGRTGRETRREVSRPRTDAVTDQAVLRGVAGPE